MNPTTKDPYSNIDLGTEPFKPETVGEELVMELTDIREVETKEGKRGVVLVGIDGDGTSRDWVGWNLHSKAEIRREKPLIGETIRIVYDGRDEGASNPAMAARLFTLSVPSRAGQQDEIPW